MAEQQERNTEIVRQAFRAWLSRDLDSLMSLISDECEWVQPGQSTISGIYRGKDQVHQLLTQLSQKTQITDATRFFAEGAMVVALTEGKLEDEQTTGVQVFTLRDGRIVRTEVYGDTALQERVYGRRAGATSRTN